MTDALRPSLVAITALARSGADGLAWTRFEDAGFAAVTDDPAVLALRGRLLKDRALRLAGAPRAAAARDAARAYAEAARLSGTAYPLINAATLSLIAGDREAAATHAREVLVLLEYGEDEPDTPYYRAATRAEALLLLGDRFGAERALGEAIARAPQAWEDHASTLRQFGTILAESGEPAAWLDAYRPPRALHYAGQIRIADERALAAAVDALLVREKIGFGFGALAAGADLLIAERLLAHGAELHITLPAAQPAFRQASVAPYGADPARFERVLAAAASVHTLDEAAAGDSGYTLAGELTDLIAMGGAAMHAAQLQTEAVQLVAGQVDAGAPVATNSARIARIWDAAGRRQHLLDTGCPPMGGEPERPAGLRIGATLVIALGDRDARWTIEERAARFAELPLPIGLIAPPSWRGDGVVLHYRGVEEAVADAARIRTSIAGRGGRIAGDLGIVQITPAPFGDAPLVLGSAAARAEQMLALTPPTAVYLSGHLARAFAAAATPDAARGLEWVGEMQVPGEECAVSLHALRARTGG